VRDFDTPKGLNFNIELEGKNFYLNHGLNEPSFHERHNAMVSNNPFSRTEVQAKSENDCLDTTREDLLEESDNNEINLSSNSEIDTHDIRKRGSFQETQKHRYMRTEIETDATPNF